MDNFSSAERSRRGRIINPDGFGKTKGSCGEVIQIYIRVNGDEIIQTKFDTNGCSGLITCGEATATLAIGKTISQALAITPDVILRELNSLAQFETHCVILAHDALKKAIKNYLRKTDSEYLEQLLPSYRERKRQLDSLQALPLEEKIAYANRIITEILDKHQKPAVAWSGGKDSTVLLYLVLQQEPSIEVVWVNTGVEYPECVKFIQKVTSDWEINLHIARPKMTFWEVIEKYGYPFFGKGNGRGYWFNRVNLWKRKGRVELARTIEVAKASTECCRILKENPANRMYRHLNTDCVVLGNIVAESHQRFLIWARKGEHFYSSSEKRWKAWPLSIWNEEDIWEFHKVYNLPYSSIYDKGHRRNGCWPCLMDLKFPDNHLRTLRHSHPRLWSFLVEKKGVGEVILALKLGLNKEEMENRASELEKRVEVLVREQPCFFDML